MSDIPREVLLARNKLDNEYTLMYKSAGEADIPVGFVTNQGDNENIIIVDIYSAILKYYDLNSNQYDMERLWDYARLNFNYFTGPDGITLLVFTMYDNPLIGEGNQVPALTLDDVNRYITVIKPNHIMFNRLTFEADFESYQSQLDNDVLRDEEVLKNIYLTQQSLLTYVPKADLIKSSDPVIRASYYSYQPKYRGKYPVEDDGLDIFNDIQTSIRIPYVKYISKNQVYHKVYHGIRQEQQPKFSNTILSDPKFSRPDTIYLNIWLGKGNDIYNSDSNEFFVAIYTLIGNNLSIETPEAAEGSVSDLAKRYVVEALKNLELGEGTEEKVRGEFEVYGVDINELTFIHTISTDRTVSKLLYVDESNTDYPNKDRFEIHYRPMFYEYVRAIARLLNQNYVTNDADLTAILTRNTSNKPRKALLNGKLEDVPPDLLTYRVNISQAASRTVVSQFIFLLKLCLLYYLDHRSQIEAFYAQLIPGTLELPILIAQRLAKPEYQVAKRTGRQGKPYLQRLKEAAPKIFTGEFTRKCQAGKQPVLILKDELKLVRIGNEVRKRTDQEISSLVSNHQVLVVDSGDGITKKLIVVEDPEEIQQLILSGEAEDYYEMVRGKKIIEFPREDTPEQQSMLLTCPEKNQYPGLKQNYDLSEGDYPYFPCCYETEKGYNTYLKYLQGIETKTEKAAKAENIITTNKILRFQGYGKLPSDITKILLGYNENTFQYDYIRMGVPLSKSSIIHSILYAMDDPNYNRLSTEQEKEAYAVMIRQKIAEQINLSIIAQETFDFTQQELLSLLRDPQAFLDPSLFFRALEEAFGINIYVFKIGYSENNNEIGEVDIPRFKLFHSRPPKPHLPVVLIMKITDGNESQCELIVNNVKDTKQVINKIYQGSIMEPICHRNLEVFMTTVTWNPLTKSNFLININQYNSINYNYLFAGKVLNQYIDENGKTRRINIIYQDKIITVATPPTQPMSVPVNSNIYPGSFEDLTALFGTPSFYKYGDEGLVEGLWFPILNLSKGIFCPMIPADVDSDMFTTEDPLKVFGSNITGRLTKLNRYLNIIIQLIRWVLLIELSAYPDTNIQQFFSNYFAPAPDDGDIDSLNFYNFDRLSRTLPSFTDPIKAMNYLQKLNTGLVKFNKFIMYNNDFSNKIKENIENFFNLVIDNPAKMKIPSFIQGFYQSAHDFDQIRGSKIFISDHDFQIWLKNMNESGGYSDYFTIHDTISGNITNIPYIYRDSDTQKIYIIQTVASKEEALAIALNWHNTKINTVYDNRFLGEILPHLLYGVDSSGKAVPIEDSRRVGSFYLTVLRHGTNYPHVGEYAAMLPIL